MSGAHGGAIALHLLRRQLQEASDAESLAALAEAYAEDPRAGARMLARQAARRLAAQEAETVRLLALFALRQALRRAGARFVAGVDEVGVGPLAGPVVAAAVVLPDDAFLPGLDDSKRLDPAARARLDAQIRAQAVALSVAEVAPAEIDRVNVLQASLCAMARAVKGLGVPVDHVLVDARTIPDLVIPQTALVHGDALDGSIAAASIVAKVHRDAQMEGLDRLHPGYAFGVHKGYPTPAHLEALRRLGPSPVHRRSFAPVAACEVRS